MTNGAPFSTRLRAMSVWRPKVPGPYFSLSFGGNFSRSNKCAQLISPFTRSKTALCEAAAALFRRVSILPLQTISCSPRRRCQGSGYNTAREWLRADSNARPTSLLPHRRGFVLAGQIPAPPSETPRRSTAGPTTAARARPAGLGGRKGWSAASQRVALLQHRPPDDVIYVR